MITLIFLIIANLNSFIIFDQQLFISKFKSCVWFLYFSLFIIQNLNNSNATPAPSMNVTNVMIKIIILLTKIEIFFSLPAVILYFSNQFVNSMIMSDAGGSGTDWDLMTWTKSMVTTLSRVCPPPSYLDQDISKHLKVLSPNSTFTLISGSKHSRPFFLTQN